MQCGLGIRPELFEPVMAHRPVLGFLEAHSENYFGDVNAKAKLLELREYYPISLHGVGLSLGRADNLDARHLAELKSLVDEVDPMIVSEHLAWSAYAHRYVPDLLPLPLTEQALTVMCQHVEQMQDALGRQVLVENPSNYMLFDRLQIPEPEFLNELAQRTGCGVLLDINNVHVSAVNLGRDENEYLLALNSEIIAQYHLAGYTEIQRDNFHSEKETLLVDTHNQAVHEPVWSLYEATLVQHGVRPTLIEWDSDVPEFEVLLNECAKADRCLSRLPKPNCLQRTQRQKPQHEPIMESFDEGIELSEAVPNSAPTAQVTECLKDTQTEFLDDAFRLSRLSRAAVPEHQARIKVYQNNVFGALQDYLAGVYPATRGVVGADFFKQMMQLTIQNHPPECGNVHRYGAQAINIIEQFDGLNALPYMDDLMAYEWALHRAYYSDVSQALDPACLPQETLLTMHVAFNNSVSVVRSNYPIHDIHCQSLPDYVGAVSIDLGQSADRLLVYKRDHQVDTMVLTDGLDAVLDRVQKKQNILQAIEALSGSIESHDLSAALAVLFDKRLLCAA